MSYKLYYFDARGLAEPARLILAHAGVKYDDIRFPADRSAGGPPPIPAEVKEKCPFGQVPILEEKDGKVLAQSGAICRYLARNHNLTGKNEWEAAKCDEYYDAVKDCLTELRPVFYEKDESKKPAMFKEVLAAITPKFLVRLNHFIEANDGKHLVGNSITWIDILLAYSIDNLKTSYNVDLANNLPALQSLTKNVFESSKIAEWVKNRPNTAF